MLWFNVKAIGAMALFLKSKEGDFAMKKHKYSRDLIEKIRDESSLVDIASNFLSLRRTSGWTRDYIGLCPFHQERHPSFRIVVEKKIFCCYGCGVFGDVFDFIMRINRFSFVESVKYLGKRSGIL